LVIKTIFITLEDGLVDADAASLARMCAHDIVPQDLEDAHSKDITKIKP
jgi:hypothetical protein